MSLALAGPATEARAKRPHAATRAATSHPARDRRPGGPAGIGWLPLLGGRASSFVQSDGSMDTAPRALVLAVVPPQRPQAPLGHRIRRPTADSGSTSWRCSAQAQCRGRANPPLQLAWAVVEPPPDPLPREARGPRHAGSRRIAPTSTSSGGDAAWLPLGPTQGACGAYLARSTPIGAMGDGSWAPLGPGPGPAWPAPRVRSSLGFRDEPLRPNPAVRPERW